MNFYFSEDEQAYRKMCADFAKNEIAPYAAMTDEEERFSFEVYDKLAAQGYLGIMTPEKYGGQGGSYLEFCIAAEEAGYYDFAITILLSSQNCVTSRTILDFGTEAQKLRYLPKLAAGVVDGKREIGAFALTEANAGSDAAGVQTTAEQKDGHYVLNGAKQFITNGSIASILLAFAKTEKGLSAFIVEDTFPGFVPGKDEKKMGMRASTTSQLFFDHCIVPKENLLGEEGQGFQIAMAALNDDRAALSLGMCSMAQRAIDESIAYAKNRVQFGKRISQFQNTKFQLADMQSKVDAARLLAYRAVYGILAHDKEATKWASMAKYVCADMVNDVTRRAVQIFGGYGYSREYPIEKLLRDSKICEIFMGTSEIQKIVIAKAMGVE